MLGERTQTRDIATGLFRGLAAATRGYMNAKVAVAQATNERDAQKARHALETARLGLIKQQQDFDQSYRQDVLASQERQAEAQRAHETQLQEITIDGQKAIAKIGADGQIEVVTIQQQGETERAGMAETGATERTRIGTESQERIAEGNQQVQREGYQSQERIAEGIQEGESGRAQIDADTRMGIAGIQQEIASQGYASAEKVAAIEGFLEQGGYNAAGTGVLDADEWGRLNDMLTKVSQNKDLTIIREIKGGFVTAMQGFIDAAQNGPKSQQPAMAQSEEAQAMGFSMADMAIINGYQRMIDPGATVREGDVDALIASMAKSEQLRAFVNQWFGTGGRFDDTSRRALAELVLNQYNANVDARSPALASQLESVLGASGLGGRGFGMNFFNIPQRENRTIDQILGAGAEWAKGIGSAAPTETPTGTAPEGTVPSGQAPGAGDMGQGQARAEEAPLMGWAEDWKSNREAGVSEEAILAELEKAIRESYPNASDEEVESMVEGVKSRVDATGHGSAIGEAQATIEEVQRMGKIASPAQLEVADIEDEEIYRALKVKFAPAGYMEFTEQDWNRYKGQSYQQMIDDGAMEAVAKAFIAKLKAEIPGSEAWAADTDE